QKQTAQHRQIDEGENSRKPLHRDALCLAWWFPDKIRCFTREEFLKNLGAQIKFRWILIVPNRESVSVVSVFQLRFDVFDFVLLHEEKIAVDVCWHVPSFVITDSIEIPQHPRKRVNT